MGPKSIIVVYMDPPEFRILQALEVISPRASQGSGSLIIHSPLLLSGPLRQIVSVFAEIFLSDSEGLIPGHGQQRGR